MMMLPHDIGWIEVICGPMFSGKTEELIRRLRRATYARQRVQIFKPKVDTRYAHEDVVSHTQQRIEARPIDRAEHIWELCDPQTSVVGVDEAQFFDRTLVEVAQKLADGGKRVVLAGLDQDFRGQPFGPMPELLAIAEYVTKVQAICMRCGNPAGRSQRLVREAGLVVVGASESYEARCRRCHGVEEPAPEQGRLFGANG